MPPGEQNRMPQRSPSPAVGRTIAVLEALVRTDSGLTLTALAKQTRIPLATCASIVYALEQHGYAARRVVGRSHFWRATLGLYGLAVQLTRKVDLGTVAQAEMQALAEKQRMPVHIGVLNGASVIYVAKAESPGFIQFNTYPGKMAPFNLTALGRAIAAQLPVEELEPLLRSLRAGSGPRARGGGRDEFLAQLDEVRRHGYAVEDEEEEANIACVAVPFYDATDRVAGAVGVTGLARDLNGPTVLSTVSALTELAADLSSRLGAGHTLAGHG